MLKRMEIEPYYHHCKVKVQDIQIVHKFAQFVMPNRDFKVTIFFNVNYLENDTRQTTIYKGKLIGSHCMIYRVSVTLNDI